MSKQFKITNLLKLILLSFGLFPIIPDKFKGVLVIVPFVFSTTQLFL